MFNFIVALQQRNVIRVGLAYLASSWFIIKILQTFHEIFGLSPDVVKTAVYLLAVGFVIALPLAWFFEITPEGIKGEWEIDRLATRGRPTSRKLDMVILILLASVLVMMAVDRFVFDPERDRVELEQARTDAVQEAMATITASRAGPNSIAVLPFLDLSAAQDQVQFAQGFSEELLNLLAQIPQLHVAARTSSFSFRDAQVPIDEIGRALNVAYVLEGSVRSDDGGLRITVQLIEAETGYHLWSENYDRPFNNIFQIQDEVAASVVEHLKLELLTDMPAAGTSNPEAYRLYLQALDYHRQLATAGNRHAMDLYRMSIALDPDFTKALDGLASLLISTREESELPIEESFSRARIAAEHAVAVNPDFAAGYSTLGWIALMFDGDLQRAAQHFSHSYQLAPRDTTVIHGVAVMLSILGRHHEAAILHRRVISMNPLAPGAYHALGIASRFAGDLQQAEENFIKMMRLSPGHSGGHYELAVTYLHQEKPTRALPELQEETVAVMKLHGIAMALFALGRLEEADQALAAFITEFGDKLPDVVAELYAFRRETDEAIQWARRSLAQSGSGVWMETRWKLAFRYLQGDSKWAVFLNDAGVSDQELAQCEFDIQL